jgi:hypothetical protein
MIAVSEAGPKLPQGQGFLKKIAPRLVSGLGGARFFSKNLAPGVILGRPLSESGIVAVCLLSGH